MVSPEEATAVRELPTSDDSDAQAQARTGTVESPMALAFAQADAARVSVEEAQYNTGQMFSVPAPSPSAPGANGANGKFSDEELSRLASLAPTPLPSNAPGPEVRPAPRQAQPAEVQETSPELNPVARLASSPEDTADSAGALGSSEEAEPTQSHPMERPSAPGGKRETLIGVRVGDYQIEGRIGIGAMGVIYRGYNSLIAKHVAIKVLRNDIVASSRDMERMLEEARVVNAIQHRNIISIFGAGELADGRQYLVMELLEGEGLDARLERETKLPLAEALGILEDVLAALEGAHHVGIVHRDLKPANVFLAKQADGKLWVKLLDFGLARKEEKREVSRIAGTPDYIAPEHARGKAPSPASDLYGFGVLAFHLLTGRLPFIGETPMQVMDQHVYSPAPSPLDYEPSLPPAMADLILKLLKKEPESRPKVWEIREALHQLRNAAAGHPVPAKAPSAPEVSVKEWVRNAQRDLKRDAEERTRTSPGGPHAPLGMVGLVMLAVGFLALGIAGGWLWARSTRASDAYWALPKPTPSEDSPGR